MSKLRLFLKWYKMLIGKSTLHVTQDVGKIYSKSEVRGYYNDLTEKVLKPGVKLDQSGLVYNLTNKGEKVYFPIAIFQYGLGSYDLYLLTGDNKYLTFFNRAVEWAIENQNDDGSWDTFTVYKFKNPYSSMAQGEGASLLVRAFLVTNDEKFIEAAKKAIDFMCLSIKDGGCTEYENDLVIFKEVIESPAILNGWIFSIWGLYDFVKVNKGKKYKILLEKTIDSLEKSIEKFDCRFWSKYDLGTKITSPFYHNLHIAQLRVMYDLFEREKFKIYYMRWKKYEQNKVYKLIAFCIKAFQKLSEKNNTVDIVG